MENESPEEMEGGDMVQPATREGSSGRHRRQKAKHAPRYEGASKILSEAIFFLVLIILVAAPLMLGSARSWALLILRSAGTVLGLLMCAKTFVEQVPTCRVNILDACVGAFIAYAGIWYMVDGTALVRGEFLNVVFYAAIFYAVARHLPSNRHAHGLAFAVVAVGAFEGVYAALMWVQDSSYIIFDEMRAEQYGNRAGGTFNCPNHLSGYLEIALPLALGYGLISKFSGAVKAGFLACGGAMVLGIILSVSRGGWIATAVAMVVLAIFLVKFTRVPKFVSLSVLGVVGLAGFAALLVSPEMLARFETMVVEQKSCRLLIYGDTLKIIEDHPWVGTGPASFEFVHLAYQNPLIQTRPVYTHSDYLNLLSDYGLVGGLMVVAFLVFLVTLYFDARKNLMGRNDTALWVGSLVALSALLVHSAVDFNMHMPANAITLLAVCAMPFALRRDPPWSIDAGRIPALALSGVLALFWVWYGITSIRVGLAEQKAALAEKHAKRGAPKVAEAVAREALALDPQLDKAVELLADIMRANALASESMEDRFRLATEALELYSKAHKLHPLQPGHILKMALSYETMARFDEAYMLYEKALVMAPHNRTVHRLMGDHFFQRGMLDMAVKKYKEVLAYAHDEKAAKALAEVERVAAGQGER